MANTITHKFNNEIADLEKLKDYLAQRMEHIRKVNGDLTRMERELQDILEMLV